VAIKLSVPPRRLVRMRTLPPQTACAVRIQEHDPKGKRREEGDRETLLHGLSARELKGRQILYALFDPVSRRERERVILNLAKKRDDDQVIRIPSSCNRSAGDWGKK